MSITLTKILAIFTILCSVQQSMAFVVTSTPKASIDVDRARHGFSFGYYDKSCTGKILYSKRKLDDDTDRSSGGIFDTSQKSPGTLLLMS